MGLGPHRAAGIQVALSGHVPGSWAIAPTHLPWGSQRLWLTPGAQGWVTIWQPGGVGSQPTGKGGSPPALASLEVLETRELVMTTAPQTAATRTNLQPFLPN